jgi:hypothetical protein
MTIDRYESDSLLGSRLTLLSNISTTNNSRVQIPSLEGSGWVNILMVVGKAALEAGN